ncbi:hypothetical protein [Streptomyces hygroscopicus]|uniref:hypothetical protein n=1 Tax=Streptomyces hygroscopicus TaxID=1912 RepID=UPI0006900E13
MSRRSRKAAPANAGAARCTVTVCRGTAKPPALDHAARLGQLRSSLAQSAQVRITGCPGACEHANANVIVIVIQPSAAGRAAGGRRPARLARPGQRPGRRGRHRGLGRADCSWSMRRSGRRPMPYGDD